MPRFEIIKRPSFSWGWELVEDSGVPLVRNGLEYSSPEDAATAIGELIRICKSRPAVLIPGNGRDVPKMAVSETRWRPIAPDGSMGTQPVPENPDEPDEGETGPAEVSFP